MTRRACVPNLQCTSSVGHDEGDFSYGVQTVSEGRLSWQNPLRCRESFVGGWQPVLEFTSGWPSASAWTARWIWWASRRSGLGGHAAGVLWVSRERAASVGWMHDERVVGTRQACRAWQQRRAGRRQWCRHPGDAARGGGTTWSCSGGGNDGCGNDGGWTTPSTFLEQSLKRESTPFFLSRMMARVCVGGGPFPSYRAQDGPRRERAHLRPTNLSAQHK